MVWFLCGKHWVNSHNYTLVLKLTIKWKLCYLTLKHYVYSSIQNWTFLKVGRTKKTKLYDNCTNQIEVSWCLTYTYIVGLLQDRCNSIANTLEICLSCTNPLMYGMQCCYHHIIKRIVCHYASKPNIDCRDKYLFVNFLWPLMISINVLQIICHYPKWPMKSHLVSCLVTLPGFKHISMT